MLLPRDATRKIECRHGGQPLGENAAVIDVVALHLHDLRCTQGPACAGVDDDDHLRADVLLEDLFDHGHEAHRIGVDCVVQQNPGPGDEAPFWRRLLWRLANHQKHP